MQWSPAPSSREPPDGCEQAQGGNNPFPGGGLVLDGNEFVDQLIRVDRSFRIDHAGLWQTGIGLG
jgi:hypothetical protein